MNIDSYLKKLNIKKKLPSLEFLNELINQHQKIISFNNLSVFYGDGKEINTDLEYLLEKVILKQKGGYCFENNKIFYQLLIELGFEAVPILARVVYNRNIDIARTHRTTVVSVGGKKYIADVGFGPYAPAKAIPLNGESIDCFGMNYFITHNDHCFELKTIRDNKDFVFYTFDQGIYNEEDFLVANYYSCTHSKAKFVKELVISKKNDGIIELISNNTYSLIDGEKRNDEEISTDEELQFYLDKLGIQDRYPLNK